MEKVGIIFAMEEELLALKEYLDLEKEYDIFNLKFYEGKINGIIWTTICLEDEVIKEGSIAVIKEINGNKLYITSK